MYDFFYHFFGVCGEHGLSHPTLFTVLVTGVVLYTISSYIYNKSENMKQV